METEIPVLSGYLNVPTQSCFSLNRISKKKTNQRYCLLFKSSRHGIERLEICETKDDKNPKIITLENCVKITQEPSPANLIQIVKKTGTLTLNALNEDDLKEWITALQTIAFREKVGTLGRNRIIEEDNDLYCSSYGDGLFNVKLIPSETSIRCNLEPKNYMLHLTATELQLKSADDLSIIISKWPYRFIRKYGYRDGKFTFEAGRKCDTGEGIFTLDHSNPQEIFRCMSSKMKSMKKLINGENLNNFDCGENQLNAALSMEAGSRSPLPPSPNSQNLNDIDSNQSLTHSSASTRGFLSSNDSLNNISSSNSTQFIKHIPNKPPRKILNIDKQQQQQQQQNNCEQLKHIQNYEPVSLTNDLNKTTNSCIIIKTPSPNKTSIIEITPPDLPIRNDNKKTERDYECIETITDAWKTLGLDHVKHTENIKSQDDLIDFVWQRTQSQRDNSQKLKIQNNKLNIDDNDIDGNYDRLDFLSPNNKITSSGYKTIVNVQPAGYKKQITNTIVNDYELISNPDIKTCRLADDSYLGYGILRKPSIPGPQIQTTVATDIITDDTNLDNRNCNGLNYAIVSKPKRV